MAKLSKSNYGQGRKVKCVKCNLKLSKIAVYGDPKNPDYNKPRCKKATHLLAINCPFAEDSHQFYSEPYNPITKKPDVSMHWPEIKDEKEFIIADAKYKQELEANNWSLIPKEEPIQKPTLLIHCFADYIDYLENENVEEYEEVQRDEKYIQNTEKYIQTFVDVLKANKVNTRRLSIYDIDKSHWNHLYNYLKDYRKEDGSAYSASTYNHYKGALTRMWNYLIEFRDYELKNPFKTVRLKRIKKNPEGVDISTFEMIMDLINPDDENRWSFKGKNRVRVNNYRPGLKLAYYAHLLIGDRPEGMTLLKWSHIKNGYFLMPNHKVNNQQNTEIYETVLPITQDIEELLFELGWAEFGGTDKYLLFPNWTSSRKSLQSLLTKSFTHYRNQLPFESKITIASLRKSAGTKWKMKLGFDPFHDTRGNKVHDNHYRDREIEGKELSESHGGGRLFEMELKKVLE